MGGFPNNATVSFMLVLFQVVLIKGNVSRRIEPRRFRPITKARNDFKKEIKIRGGGKWPVKNV